ncbi:hypothetical protein AB0D59_08655 [Streptomyces sp. NPDC048417]|uniref:hypothetical protein n=1 Tax=Streptomyces sp. NPDC048417 TaxID=3155387 RepID=UPI00343508C0
MTTVDISYAEGWDADTRRPYRPLSAAGAGDGDDGVEEVRTGTVRVADEKTGGDLVTFYTEGDGTWSVWLGRAASGDVVCVVVVTGRLSDYRPL